MDWKEGIKGGPFTQEQTDQLLKVLSDFDYGQIQWLSGYFAGAGKNVQLKQALLSGIDVLDSAKEGYEAPASLYILYGTQTGNAEKLAQAMEAKTKALGINTIVKSMAVFKVKDFKKVTNLAIIVSTQGMGEPPIEAAELHSILHSKKAPDLSGIKYSVLALGDTSYTDFCQTGKEFDSILAKLGAEQLCPRRDCDVDYEEDALAWMESFIKQLNRHQPSFKVKPSNGHIIGTEVLPKYNRKNPYQATLLEKINLNGRGSSKETIHLELSIKGSGITYAPGDSLGVYAPNSKGLVEKVLNTLHLSGSEEVDTPSGTKSLQEALTYDYELTPLTTLSLSRYAELTGSTNLKKMLKDKANVEAYIYGRDLIDLFKEYPFKMNASELISVLRKNTARMYSIASSQEAYEDEIHLLVSVVRYQAYGRSREGLCSSYLADRLAIDDKLKIFVEENIRFRLPEDDTVPIIMVGPGTGIAPFRAFIQQREAKGAEGKSWLFFGDRNFTTDFLYQAEWKQYLKEGILTKMDVAFSRDTNCKVYVQHRMLEKGKELFQWLEEGAHFYVCGDATSMAKDVDKTLKEIVRLYGNKSMEEAEEYVKYLQLSNRYQTDVY